MSMQPEINTQLRMKVGLLPENIQDARATDIALQKLVGREVVADLRQEGWIVTPAEPDQRGGDFLILVQVVGQAVTFAKEVWEYSTVVGQSFETIERLWTIISIATLIGRKITQGYRKHRRPELEQKKPVQMRIEIEGVAMTLTIDADKESDKEMARQLIEQFCQRFPEKAKQINEHSQVTIHGILPNQEE